MSQNLKTRREHLKVLPLQKRLQAMENIRKEAFPSFQKALDYIDVHGNFLIGTFTFYYSREGADYWFNINAKYFQDGK
jgi:hypothetical protein